jgi:HSP20 family molecular chaperone IbpA
MLSDLLRSETGQKAPPQKEISSMFKCASKDPSPSPINTLTYDMFETDTHMVLYVDIPGVDKESIRVTYDSPVECRKKTLNITCDRYAPHSSGASSKSQSNYGTKSVSLLLKRAPQSLTIDDIKAKVDNGVLIVQVPKGQAVQAEQRYVRID